MDLANLVCKVRNPDCEICPIEALCLSKGLKFKPKKKIKFRHKIAVALVINHEKHFLVEKNSKNLLKNLFCFPLSDTKEVDKDFIESEFLHKTVNSWLKKNKIKVPFKYVGKVKHNFSHFQLKVLVVKLELTNKFKLEKYSWVTITELNNKPVSKLMMKIKEIVK